MGSCKGQNKISCRWQVHKQAYSWRLASRLWPGSVKPEICSSTTAMLCVDSEKSRDVVLLPEKIQPEFINFNLPKSKPDFPSFANQSI